MHGWLEIAKPHVFILSDGSGGNGQSRLAYSQTLIEAAGARKGAVFGECSDRQWYQAMLEGDAELFKSRQNDIFQTAATNRIDMIVTDPVEFYNPLHDLANAMAHGVAARSARQAGLSAQVWTYEIANLRRPGAGSAKIPLDDRQIDRKINAAKSYLPLSSEAEEFGGRLRAKSERLFAEGSGFAWPVELGFEPYYEEVGRSRTLHGKYESIITYREHVRPIALAIGGGR